jgi:hypothetical protein
VPAIAGPPEGLRFLLPPDRRPGPDPANDRTDQRMKVRTR